MAPLKSTLKHYPILKHRMRRGKIELIGWQQRSLSDSSVGDCGADDGRWRPSNPFKRISWRLTDTTNLFVNIYC